jgi:hypothetical protein
MVLVDPILPFRHVQIIRCDIKPKSVGRSRDVENKKFTVKSSTTNKNRENRINDGIHISFI